MHNEKAANDLLDAVEKAIMERLPIAESFEPFRSVKKGNTNTIVFMLRILLFIMW